MPSQINKLVSFLEEASKHFEEKNTEAGIQLIFDILTVQRANVRIPSAFNLYTRQVMANETSSLPCSKRIKFISEKWKSMSFEEREPFMKEKEELSHQKRLKMIELESQILNKHVLMGKRKYVRKENDQENNQENDKENDQEDNQDQVHSPLPPLLPPPLPSISLLPPPSAPPVPSVPSELQDESDQSSIQPTSVKQKSRPKRKLGVRGCEKKVEEKEKEEEKEEDEEKERETELRNRKKQKKKEEMNKNKNKKNKKDEDENKNDSDPYISSGPGSPVIIPKWNIGSSHPPSEVEKENENENEEESLENHVYVNVDCNSDSNSNSDSS